ncbi:monovalent cation/H(+) antiporter subunit G [Pigmentiphaga sp.]|jgi:monovalent cation/proton antiporter, MnhG/PhaG subunit|uniref:monovalent cation/H(+) antiporter subunit G n=1 Tax=Pigmentiphaga sp. TaxID=1977564 RepID=UPI0025D7CDBC|nr:monovalent cation/H(+) antiporter subunit G [Pigmentiphaga sp.]MBX6319327.1 cation:proton antiporter [Pigmentiphaga sp.]
MTTELVLPLWADLLISALLVFGGLLTLIGCLGLWRFHSFYQRLHGPTLGATMGMVSLAIASMLYFSLTSDGPALHEILIAIFLTLTVPATTLMLARAALYRHRRAGKAVPAPDRPPGPGAEPPHYTTDDIDDEHRVDADKAPPPAGGPGGER